jgi:hypothetical protein
MSVILRVALLIVAIILSSGPTPSSVHAAVAVFEPSADLCMGSMAPYRNNNEGVEYWFPIGDNYSPGPMDCRTILRFDVAALGTSNLQVNSIALRLTSVGIWAYDNQGNLIMDSQLDNLNPVHPEIHAIQAANRDWQEGTGTGYDFVPNQTCYAAKQTGTTAGSVVKPWAGSAGLTTPGTDYDSTVLSTKTLYKAQVQSIGQTVEFNFSGTSAQLTGLIDSWLEDNLQSRDNPGLLIFDPTTSQGPAGRRVGFFSRQCTNPPWPGVQSFPASCRPQLIVNYSVVPEPRALALLASGLIALPVYAWRKRRRKWCWGGL